MGFDGLIIQGYGTVRLRDGQIYVHKRATRYSLTVHVHHSFSLLGPLGYESKETPAK